jgi:predicted nucleotidyltransferase
VIVFEKTLKRLDEFCFKENIEYAVIGGIAVVSYDYQRTTKDVDITVLCKIEEMEVIHKKFLKEYYPLYNDSLQFFSSNFLLPVKDRETKIKIDVAAGLTLFDETIIKRKKRTKLGKAEFNICTLEDLIVYKLFAARFADLADIEILVRKNKNKIDFNYLVKTVEKFKELDREDMLQNLNKLLPQ